MLSSQDCARVEAIRPQPSLKRFKVSEERGVRSEIEACCMWHRIVLTEDFESESETEQVSTTAPEDESLVFLTKCPPEVEHELFRLISTDEKSIQTMNFDPMPLSVAANFSVFGTKASLPEIKASSKTKPLQHRIKLAIRGSISPLSITESNCYGISCHNCNRVFKTHQALGGHLSRKHR